MAHCVWGPVRGRECEGETPAAVRREGRVAAHRESTLLSQAVRGTHTRQVTASANVRPPGNVLRPTWTEGRQEEPESCCK